MSCNKNITYVHLVHVIEENEEFLNVVLNDREIRNYKDFLRPVDKMSYPTLNLNRLKRSTNLDQYLETVLIVFFLHSKRVTVSYRKFLFQSPKVI